jgi:CarD family transcriptional regulator
VSSKKVSAATAVKGRVGANSRRAAPGRSAPAAAKAAQSATVRKTAAPAKPAKPATNKVATKQAAKAPPAAIKPKSARPETKSAAGAQVAGAAPKPQVTKPPAAPPQAVRPSAPAPTAVRPAPQPPVAAAAISPAERRPATPDRPPPRPMAKAEIFIEGDHVVYPTHGVGKVERIATEEIAGHKLELIHITFEENRMTLRVPVAKARTAGLRKLATRKLFDEALAVLKGRARIKRTMWSRRAQEYEAKINSGDPLAIAEVVRDLHRNAGQPDQSFSERQIYEAAMDRLAAELAALDKTDKLTAASKLANFLKTV